MTTSATGQLVYGRGRIAAGSGDLIDVTNIKVTTTNNAKQVHTIRRGQAGITLGVQETTVTFDCKIGEEGLERDYVTSVSEGLIEHLRIKVPGATYTVEGSYQSTDFDLPLDDAITLSLTFIGKLTQS